MTASGRMLLMTIGLLAACNESQGPSPQPPEPLAIVGSPAASDTALAMPVQGLVVEVRDQAGDLLSNTTVRFVPLTVTRNGITIINMAVATPTGQHGALASVNTNDRGRATALIRFGQFAGPAGVEITVPELGLADTVAFTVNPGNAAGVRLEPRDTTVSAGASFTVRGGVVDQYGNTRSDPITFSAVVAPISGGSVSASGQVTASSPGPIKVAGVAGSGADTVSVSVVPVGTVAAYDAGSGLFVLIDLDGGGRQPITQSPVSLGQEFEPAWARDGAEIVFTAINGLAVLRVATGELISLAAGPESLWPAFAPDGQRIFFSVSDGSGARVARIDRDGSNFSLLTAGPFDSRVSFAPDGKTFIYHSVDNGLVLRMYSLESNSVLPFSRPGIFPEWSPTGNRIVYFTIDSELRIMDGDGSNDRNLAPAGRYQYGQTSWSPDGRWLLLRGSGVELLGIADDVKGIAVTTGIRSELRGAIWRP